ncbi:LysM peptidoglycan-binding domain-containing protein [Botrimarina hoheduenensis]|uniref:LysM domain protein n=1 Tax=Botrimarina hoheduenensis TaxID=2528000 RepID=A0A5C5W693_9BACT|nr:LysM domain-containing protein [Botrimarina hoheduenensis]TWT46406.1 LysM domain protein [Botrimarina hoheduenensis]
MSTIRPLATIAVLAAIGFFLVLKINDGGKAFDDGFGLQPAEVSMASPEGVSDEAPLFELTGSPATGTDLAPPAFGETKRETTKPQALLDGMDEGANEAALPELPELPEIEGQPLPSTAEPATGRPGTAVASVVTPPASSAAPRYGEPLSPSAAIPTDRYGQPTNDLAPSYEATPSAASADGSVTGRLSPTQPSNAPAQPGSSEQDALPPYENYTESETTPLNFGAPAEDPSQADWTAAQAALRVGDLSEAHRLLSAWRADSRVEPARRAEIDRLLSGLAGTLIYDSREHRLAPAHVVQAGETLESIAAQYNVPWRLLAKINGVPAADAVRPGQSLKVIPGPFSAEIHPETNELVLMLGDRFAGRFEVTAEALPYDAIELRVQDIAPAPAGSIVLVGATAPITIGPSTGRYGGPEVVVAPRDAEELTDILSVGSTVIIRR